MAIEFQHISKRFADTRALEDVSLTFEEGKIYGLLGNNGAGKSTLLNHLTGAGIPANNRLFDTLDTTSRLLTVSDTLDVVISDTVGFIRKLPHQLVEAFKATLEELEYADLLLHVIDVSNPEWQQQAAVVESWGPESCPGSTCSTSPTGCPPERSCPTVRISAPSPPRPARVWTSCWR